MHAHLVLLSAGIGDFLTALVPIVFLIIYALNQLLTVNRQRPPAPKGQRRGPQQVERGLDRPRQAPAGRGEQAQLNAEIEQFLKRASQRRDERTGRPKAPAKTPPQPPKPPRREEPIEAHSVDRPPLSTVAESVEKHLANRGFAERAAHLADDITHADQSMEAHLQQAFGRRVGTLGSSGPPAADAPLTDVAPVAADRAASAASELAARLATPQGMREAVILNELLQRPEHRW